MLEICSPFRFASFLACGTAARSCSTPTWPDAYPAWTSVAAAPAIVPPVARTVMFGSWPFAAVWAGAGIAATVRTRVAVRMNAIRLDMSCLLFRQENDDRSPRRQENVPDGIGDRVTEHGKFALRLVLDRPQRRGDRPRSGRCPEKDDRIHLQDLPAEEQGRQVRGGGDDEPDKEKARPGLAQSVHEARAGGEADDAADRGEAGRGQDPAPRRRDPPDRRTDRAQPAEYEPHDESAAAGGQRERDASDLHGQDAEQAANDDAQPEEDDVGRLRG